MINPVRIFTLFIVTLACVVPLRGQASAGLALQTYGGLSITGTVGAVYTVQSTTSLSEPRDWRAVVSVQLPSSPYLWVDTSGPATGQRFYRAVTGPTNLAWIPPCTFTLGSPPGELQRYVEEGPETVVTLSHGYFIGRYEVTQDEYQSVMGNNPSYFQNGQRAIGSGGEVTHAERHPVDNVSWIDATNYCARLTARERLAGRVPEGWAYRLPTEAEWELACRAGTTGPFHYGPALRSGMENFVGDSEYDAAVGVVDNPSGIFLGRTTEVGSYTANGFGLYDMHGNVHELCADNWADALPGGQVVDPQGPPPALDVMIVTRGGSWASEARGCRSAVRGSRQIISPSIYNGFRVVLSPVPKLDPRTVVPTNMAWISSGTLMMGSPASEPERFDSEGPQTHVTLTHGFYMGKYEVTQGEFLSVMGHNNSYFKNGVTPPHGGSGGAVINAAQHPVESVSWFEATEYCEKLTARERLAGRLPAGWTYRLPTEAEWEYACRAYTLSAFHYGAALRSGMANFSGLKEYDSATGTINNPSGINLGRTSEVGKYAPNSFGLYDMHGNVWEWCQDWFGPYPGGDVLNPKGPAQGGSRVARGGSWGIEAATCRSASRYGPDPGSAYEWIGFRVVLALTQP
ncbi:MAG TPA: formylglycine-generating enzyme family protein [Verrucomicrobiae bacterium]|nr:formylglycine-generating enzyme family protein [Verrucomicrobiae bacterium]